MLIWCEITSNFRVSPIMSWATEKEKLMINATGWGYLGIQINPKKNILLNSYSSWKKALPLTFVRIPPFS